MPNEFGTKELQEVLSLGIALGNGVGKSLADGKVDFEDLSNFVDALSRIPAALDGITQVPKEVADLNKGEMQSLKATIQRDFDIPDDQVEAAMEHSLGTILHLYQSALIWKNISQGQSSNS